MASSGLSSPPISSAELSPESFAPLLDKLFNTPQELTPHDVTLCFQHLAKKQATDEIQLASFLTALHMSSLDFKGSVLSGGAEVMREHAITPPDIRRRPDEVILDIVGTGGDEYSTFNVSTLSAIIAAGAGVLTAKHGSNASTSSCGSADLLLAMGCSLSFPPERLPAIYQSNAETPFAFLFASVFHPAIYSAIAPVRSALPFRTVFNILGPLLNPARPSHVMLGVLSYDLGEVFTDALRKLGVKRALVVCGKENLDEISPQGETWVWSLENGVVSQLTYHPTRDFGLPTYPLSSCVGGDPSKNSKMAMTLLQNPTPFPEELVPIRDWTIMNTAAALFVAEKVSTLKEGVEVARKSLEGGKALQAFEGFKKASLRETAPITNAA